MLNRKTEEKSDSKPDFASFSTRPARIPRPPQLKRPGFRPTRRLAGFLILPLACLLLGLGGGWLGARIYDNDPSRNVSTEAKQRNISSEGELISEIAGTVGKGVVSINVQSDVTGTDIFGVPRTSRQLSAGSGFIIDPEGVIMTNRHVVGSGTTSVSVTLHDGTRFDDVQILGRTSPSSPLDIAFLKIRDLKGKRLTPLVIGDSSKMEVGFRVIAIGNALGQFENSVTSGIISGYGRDVTASDGTGEAERLSDLFQTDAAINEGNSGGPLVNFSGEVIGVNTAVAGGAQNIGFAIPINDTKGLISSVLESGRLQQPYLGVRYVSLTDDLSVEYGLSVKRGAYITPANGGEPSILPGSPAEKAGVREGDVILKVNSTVIDDKTSLTGALNQFKVGDSVNLQIWRGGRTILVKATLESLPGT